MKTAAAMADAGEIRNVVECIWKGEAMDELHEDPMQKVCKERTRAHTSSQLLGGQASYRQDKRGTTRTLRHHL